MNAASALPEMKAHLQMLDLLHNLLREQVVMEGYPQQAQSFCDEHGSPRT